MQAVANTYLTFIPYINFDLWDTKRYTTKGISSTFNIVDLGTCIKEENAKYKLFEEEETEFGILGVNNKEGIFDAYTQKGKEINQAYKKMEMGWLAYNPYRINVGSIGVKLPQHKNQYISPAYVVFSCLPTILPQYLFLLFKTQKFNTIINESTTGSVRQNLTIDILKKLKIPLPTLQIQQSLIDKYNAKINDAKCLAKQGDDLENEIEKYLFEQLGYKRKEKKKVSSKMEIIEYKDLDRWDGKGEKMLSFKYEVVKIGRYITEISTGTTPPTNRPEYFDGDINFYTPAELGNEMYLTNSERKINEIAFIDKKARKFYKGTILFVGIGSTVGKVGIIENEYATSNQQITGFKIEQSKLTNEFVYYYFNYFKDVTTGEQTKATLPIVNQEKIINIPIPVPPLQLQKEIVNGINTLKLKIETINKTYNKFVDDATQEFETAIFN